jgi:release factor glutamine methyltransferase
MRATEATFISDDHHSVNELIDRYCGRMFFLADKPEETPEATVRALWLSAAGVPASAAGAMTSALPALTAAQRRQLHDWLERRADGVPLAHLTGRQRFMGLDFICTPQALIPRKETEILGEAALAILQEEVRCPHPRVLDLCTGSGNLACALAIHMPQCAVFAADLSPEAVELAVRNARALLCADRVTAVAGDLFAPFDSPPHLASFDLITCNPPYITSAKVASLDPEIIGHEPAMAFDAGPLGLAVLWRLLQDAPRFLKPGGWLAFEVGLGQGRALLQRLSRNPRFAHQQGKTDGAGKIRAIVAQFKEVD